MGADNSRIFSPSEEEDAIYSHYRRMGVERKEATSTTIDIGFAIRASTPNEGGRLKDFSNAELHSVVSRTRTLL